MHDGISERGTTRSLNKEGKRGAIWAILYHSASSDENPQHDHYPEGETSWCGWQRDQAKGTDSYQHKSPLAPAVVAVIRPTFEALSADELLDRCLEGANQNQNESLKLLTRKTVNVLTMREKRRKSVPWKQDSKGEMTEDMRRTTTLKERAKLMFLEDFERHLHK